MAVVWHHQSTKLIKHHLIIGINVIGCPISLYQTANVYTTRPSPVKADNSTDEGIMNQEETGKELPDSKDYEVPAIISDNLVLFPGTEVITAVRDENGLSSLREVLKQHQILAYIPSSSRVAEGAIGTLALVKNSEIMQSGVGLSVELKGMWRIRVKKFIHSFGYPKVQFEKVDESTVTNSPDARSLSGESPA